MSPAATVHDFFNILAVIIFLPNEMAFGWLERLSALLIGRAEHIFRAAVGTFFLLPLLCLGIYRLFA